MTRSLLLLSATALLLPAYHAAAKSSDQAVEASTPVPVAAGADERAIRAQVDRWHQLIKAKDAAGITGLYTSDGAVMPPNAPIGKGPGAIQQVWTSLLQIPGFELSIIPEQVDVSSSGDMAIDRGVYKLTIAPDGKTKSDTGKYVVVWRKVGGEWKAAADIFNSDLPASGG